MAQALLDGFCPPALTCLLLCSVLSTGMFAVLHIYLSKWITWFFALWDGRKAGRNASMYVAASEPPNPFWAVYEDLLIFS